jgi:hypothetical protein
MSKYKGRHEAPKESSAKRSRVAKAVRGLVRGMTRPEASAPTVEPLPMTVFQSQEASDRAESITLLTKGQELQLSSFEPLANVAQVEQAVGLRNTELLAIIRTRHDNYTDPYTARRAEAMNTMYILREWPSADSNMVSDQVPRCIIMGHDQLEAIHQSTAATGKMPQLRQDSYQVLRPTHWLQIGRSEHSYLPAHLDYEKGDKVFPRTAYDLVSREQAMVRMDHYGNVSIIDGGTERPSTQGTAVVHGSVSSQRLIDIMHAPTVGTPHLSGALAAAQYMSPEVGHMRSDATGHFQPGADPWFTAEQRELVNHYDPGPIMQQR